MNEGSEPYQRDAGTHVSHTADTPSRRDGTLQRLERDRPVVDLDRQRVASITDLTARLVLGGSDLVEHAVGDLDRTVGGRDRDREIKRLRQPEGDVTVVRGHGCTVFDAVVGLSVTECRPLCHSEDSVVVGSCLLWPNRSPPSKRTSSYALLPLA